LLFGTNHETTKNDVASWFELFKSMGATVSDFNTSYMGDWQLDERSSNQTFTLFTDFLKGVVVILNNEYTLNTGDKVHAASLISEKDMFVGASAYNLGFVVWGPDTEAAGFDAKDHLLLTDDPASDDKRIRKFKSLKEYITYRNRQGLHSWAIKDEDPDNFKENYSPEVPEIDASKNYWFFSPRKKHLERQANKLSARLKNLFPLSRFFVIYDYQPDDQKGSFKNRKLGTIRIQESLPVTANSLVQVSPDHIQDQASILALLTAMPFKLKLETLSRIIAEKAENKTYGKNIKWSDMMELLVDAVSMHIAREMIALNSQPGSSVRDSKANKERFVDLRKMAEDSEFDFKPDSDEGKYLLELSARLLYLNNQSTSWYHHVIPFLVGKRRYKNSAEELIRNFVKEAMESIDTKTPVFESVQKRAEEIAMKAKSKSKSTKIEKAKLQLSQSERDFGITTSADDIDSEKWVMTRKEFEAARDEYIAREAKRDSLAKRKETDRQDFAVEKENCPQFFQAMATYANHVAVGVAK